MEPKDIAFLVFLVVVLIGVYYWFQSKHQKTRAVWRALAKELGGTFENEARKIYETPRYAVDFEIDGLPLRLCFRIESQGDSSSYYTEVRSSCDPAVDFVIYREGVLQTFGKLVGTQDVTVGDIRYDQEFMIKSETPDRLLEGLNQELRSLHLEDPSLQLTAGAGELCVIRQGLIRDKDLLLHLIALGVLTGRSFAGESSVS